METYPFLFMSDFDDAVVKRMDKECVMSVFELLSCSHVSESDFKNLTLLKQHDPFLLFKQELLCSFASLDMNPNRLYDTYIRQDRKLVPVDPGEGTAAPVLYKDCNSASDYFDRLTRTYGKMLRDIFSRYVAVCNVLVGYHLKHLSHVFRLTQLGQTLLSSFQQATKCLSLSDVHGGFFQEKADRYLELYGLEEKRFCVSSIAETLREIVGGLIKVLFCAVISSSRQFQLSMFADQKGLTVGDCTWPSVDAAFSIFFVFFFYSHPPTISGQRLSSEDIVFFNYSRRAMGFPEIIVSNEVPGLPSVLNHDGVGVYDSFSSLCIACLNELKLL